MNARCIFYHCLALALLGTSTTAIAKSKARQLVAKPTPVRSMALAASRMPHRRTAHLSVKPVLEIPVVANGLEIDVFATAPDIYSPGAIAATPDGDVFVAIDEYNSTGKTTGEKGLSFIVLCRDSDDDGKADRFTIFARRLNICHGMTYIDGTLYVVHAPTLTALYDRDGDGVAERRKDLITGLGPPPGGYTQHLPADCTMAVDGRLYIAVGSQGVAGARGLDGSKVSNAGSCILRVRPDGTSLELFARGFHNIRGVAVDPYLNVFVRDSANPAVGWPAALYHVIDGADYGYPYQFARFSDETPPPLALLEDGEAGGCTLVAESWFPNRTHAPLVTTDFARSRLMYHALRNTYKGYETTDHDLGRFANVIDTDVDGIGNLFVAAWDRARGDVRKEGVAGTIYRLSTAQNRSPTFPDLKTATDIELVDHLLSHSHVLRMNAMCALIRRGSSDEAIGRLQNICRHNYPAYSRIAALFALKPLMGAESTTFFLDLLEYEDIIPLVATVLADNVPYVFRALSDPPDSDSMVSTETFTPFLADDITSIRYEATAALMRLGSADAAAHVAPLLADRAPRVRHAAVRALRRMGAYQVCLDMLDDRDANAASGALSTLRGIYDTNAVILIMQAYRAAETDERRGHLIDVMARLCQKPGTFEGNWWGLVPGTNRLSATRARWHGTPIVVSGLTQILTGSDTQRALEVLENVQRNILRDMLPAVADAARRPGPLRSVAARVLCSIPDAAMATEYAAIARSSDIEEATRLLAIQAAMVLPEPSRDKVLITMYNAFAANPDVPPTLRAAMGSALAHIQSPARLATLTAFYQTGDDSARRGILASVLRMPSKTTKRSILKVLLHPGELDRVLDVMQSLPGDRLRNFRRYIATGLDDPSPAVRLAAMKAMLRIGDNKDFAAVAGAGKDDPLLAARAFESLPAADVPRQWRLNVLGIAVRAADIASRESPEHYTTLRAYAAAVADVSSVPEHASVRPHGSIPAKEVDLLHQMHAAIADFQVIAPLPNDKLSTPLDYPDFHPTGPFQSITRENVEYRWESIKPTGPRGTVVLHDRYFRYPDRLAYLRTIIESSDRREAVLRVGSGADVNVWLNGERVHRHRGERVYAAGQDKVAIVLEAGENLLLFKVLNNWGDWKFSAQLETESTPH